MSVYARQVLRSTTWKTVLPPRWLDTALTGAAERPPRGDVSPLRRARRGRKKRQTRDALIDAALDLFEAKGYEHTAVHEITDAVDVAERTFFRYFASKEDLALFFVKQQMDGFADALGARHESEVPLTAVRNAFRQTLEQLQGDGHARNGEARYLSSHQADRLDACAARRQPPLRLRQQRKGCRRARQA